MQVKSEGFSRFGSSPSASSAPLGGGGQIYQKHNRLTHTEGPRRGPTNHSRGSEGQSPERPTDARCLLIYRPLVGRTKRIYSSSPTSRQGRSLPPYMPLYPPVVRSFAPPTGGYDSSDRKRSLPSSPVLVLLYDNGTCSPLHQSETCNPL